MMGVDQPLNGISVFHLMLLVSLQCSGRPMSLLTPGAETGFGFKRGPAQRKVFATPSNRVADGGVQESEINRQTFRCCDAVEAEVVADGGIAVADACDEAKNVIAAPNYGATELCAERA